MAKIKVGKTVESLGEYLHEQRVTAQLSLRQLAEQAGVSNPYLSQIERGLRRPSAEVLQQLAKALRISAEQLYVQAGILNPDDGDRSLRRARHPRGPGAHRAAEAVPARRLRVVPRRQRRRPTPPDRPRHACRATTTRRSTTWPRPSSTSPRRSRPPRRRPLYAGVGVTDLVVETVRDYVADVQKRLDDVQKSVSGLETKPEVLRDRASKAVADTIDTLTKDTEGPPHADRAARRRAPVRGADLPDPPAEARRRAGRHRW